MKAKHQNRKADVLFYLFITLVYALVWFAVFSRMQHGPYLVLAVFVALAYTGGQTYSMFVQGKLALSADSVALPASIVMMVVSIAVMEKGEWLHASLRIYLDILLRFFSAFLLGHIVVMTIAFAADKVRSR